MQFPARVKLVEVGARDGLQNETQLVDTATKIELINRLSETGLPVIEITSFVSPKWVPQMGDSKEVVRGILRQPGVSYPCLAPNLRGYLDARIAGAEEVAVFTSAGEAFCKRNTNCSIAESLQRCAQIVAAAHADEVRVRGYVSCIFEDPYLGPTPPEQVLHVTRALLDLGCYEVSLGDTTGVGTPGSTLRLLTTLLGAGVPAARLALHLHDTFGQALANLLIGLQLGIATIDASVAGLGGCPYARGATGNVATEDVVYMLHGLGIETGVDLDKLVAVGQFISARLGRAPTSRVNAALTNKKLMAQEASKQHHREDPSSR